MIKKIELYWLGRGGAHARASVRLSDVLHSYSDDVLIKNLELPTIEGYSDAKVVTEVLLQGIAVGDLVEFVVRGPNAQKILQRIKLFMENEISVEPLFEPIDDWDYKIKFNDSQNQIHHS